MHPSSGTAKTWRHLDRREGYWQRRWWVGDRDVRKQHSQLEHRWVWEEATGEQLTPEMVIHHRDGNRTNNRFENLERLTRVEHDLHHGRGRRQRPGEQQCSRCLVWLPHAAYYWCKSEARRHRYCKPCHNAMKRAKRQMVKAG